MSVSQLKDGRWIVQWQEGGRQRRQYFGRGPVAEAAARRRQEEIALRRLTPRQPRGGMSFSELTQAYLDGQAPLMQESSLDRAFTKLSRIINPVLGALPAGAITAEVVDQYVQLRQRSVKRTTIHSEVGLVRTILRWGVRRRMLAIDPLDGYQKPTRDDAIITPPTPEEITRIWECSAHHLRRIIALQWFLGMRPGHEVLSLTWDAVDLQAGYITIQSAKKHGLRTRRIALHPILRGWMVEWYAIDLKRKQRHIINFRGQRIRNPSTAWREAKRKAGVTRRLRLYDLRHAWATSLLMAGENPKVVSVLMGHANVGTTLATYTHATEEAQKMAINRVVPFDIGLSIPRLPQQADTND